MYPDRSLSAPSGGVSFFRRFVGRIDSAPFPPKLEILKLLRGKKMFFPDNYCTERCGVPLWTAPPQSVPCRAGQAAGVQAPTYIVLPRDFFPTCSVDHRTFADSTSRARQISHTPVHIMQPQPRPWLHTQHLPPIDRVFFFAQCLRVATFFGNEILFQRRRETAYSRSHSEQADFEASPSTAFLPM